MAFTLKFIYFYSETGNWLVNPTQILQKKYIQLGLVKLFIVFFSNNNNTIEY